MAAIYNPWGGMGKVSPASVTGENPWARFTNTGDSKYKDRENTGFFNNEGVIPSASSSSGALFPSNQSPGIKSIQTTPANSMDFYRSKGLFRNSPDAYQDAPKRFDPNSGPFGLHNATPEDARQYETWLRILDAQKPKRNFGQKVAGAIANMWPILAVLGPMMAGVGGAAGAAAEGGSAAAGAGSAAGAGGWTVGAGEALGGGLGSAFGLTEGAALGASELAPALAGAADPIELGATAMDITGTSSFTEAASALGYESFGELAGAVNPGWVGGATTGFSLSPRMRNTLIRSGTGAASNPREPLKGAALGAVSANLPSVTNPAIEKLGLPDWASRGLSSATNSSILQAIGEGKIDPKTVLQKLVTGSAGGLSGITGIDPGLLENIAGQGMGLFNRMTSSNALQKQIASRMLMKGRQQSDLGINTPSEVFDPAMFLEQDTQQREFNKRREAIAARNAEIQREFQRRKAQAPTLNPELFSGR